MQFRLLHFASWLTGLAGLVAVIWYFQPTGFATTLRSVGITGGLIWIALTMSARFLLAEITVIPIHVLGFRFDRSDAFWIGWIRSFSNQILPLSGLALYTHEIRRKAGLSWSEITSLSTPQIFLAASALGLMGTVATALNAEPMGQAAIPMTLAFVAVGGGAILAATKTAWVIEALPNSLALRAKDAATAFRQLAQRPHLMLGLVTMHCAAMLLRGGRIWVLFAVTGIQLNWQEALMIVAVAECATLFQITPGGLGLREGAIVGAAAILHIPPDAAAGVALIDRLFVIAITTLFAAPAVVLTRRNKKYEEPTAT